MAPDDMRDNNMFMGTPLFPQYLWYKYKRIHSPWKRKGKSHRINRSLPGLPGWRVTSWYSREIEKVNKRRKKNETAVRSRLHVR